MTADRLDEKLVAHFTGDEADGVAAARVLARLDGPLPSQRTELGKRLPAILLDWQFAPAWPRLAALACCAALGFVVGINSSDLLINPGASANDLATLAFEPEPLTGLRP